MLLMQLMVSVLAVGLVQATDCDFSGGWALRDPSGCPTNTTVCTGGYEARCCPSSYFCFTTDTAYCCPSNEDCLQDVLNVPRCPNPDWSLWDNGDISGSWCCGPEMFGLAVTNVGVGCTPFGSTLSHGQATATAITDAQSLCSTSSSTFSFSSTPSSMPPTTRLISPVPSPTNTGGFVSTPSTSTSTSPSPPTTGTAGGGSKLSGGAIAGIAIGAAAIVVICVLAWWLFVKRPRQNNTTGGPEMQPTLIRTGELEGKPQAVNNTIHPIHEMDNRQHVFELGSSQDWRR